MAKKKLKPWQQYLLSGASMILYSLIFTLMSLVFMIDKIPAFVQIIIGAVFEVPIALLFFSMGKKAGENLFKEASKASLTEVHDKQPIKIPFYKGLFHVLLYALPFLFLLLLSVIIKNVFIRGVVAIFFMPFTLIYVGSGAVDFNVVTWSSFWLYLPAILFGCAAFMAGYVLSILKLKQRQGEIENEIRMFHG